MQSFAVPGLHSSGNGVYQSVRRRPSTRIHGGAFRSRCPRLLNPKTATILRGGPGIAMIPWNFVYHEIFLGPLRIDIWQRHIW
jgi:hypothetical protein